MERLEEEVIFEYRGKGEVFEIDNIENITEVIFHFKTLLNSRVEISFEFNNNIDLLMFGFNEKKHFKFIGKDGEYFLTIHDFVISSLTISSKGNTFIPVPMMGIIISSTKDLSISDKIKKVEYGILNFLFHGNKSSKNSDGRTVYNTLEFKIDGNIINIIQNENFDKISDYISKRNGTSITSTLIIENVNKEELSVQIEDLLHLISFSQLTEVTWLYLKMKDIDGKEFIFIRQNRNIDFSSFNLIYPYISRSDDLVSYIEQTYPKYKEINEGFNKYLIVDFFCRSQFTDSTVSGYLYIVSIIEPLLEFSIKKYEIQIDKDERMIEEKINMIDNFLKNREHNISSQDIKDLAIKISHKTFQSKMIGVNNHFSLGFDDCEINNIKDNRDSVVHSNLFSSDVNPVKDLRQIQLFAQKTFLKKGGIHLAPKDN